MAPGSLFNFPQNMRCGGIDEVRGRENLFPHARRNTVPIFLQLFDPITFLAKNGAGQSFRRDNAVLCVISCGDRANFKGIVDVSPQRFRFLRGKRNKL